MRMEDVFFDEDAPHDPLLYVEESPGALYVPLTGLMCDREDVRVGDFRLVKVHPRAWRAIEKNWLVDLYQEFYAASPRYYCVIPCDSADDMIEDVNGFLGEALTAPAALVLALRLSVPGFVVDPHYSTPVLRVDGMNHRGVGRERYRLYGTVFGEDIVLQRKHRRIGDRTISYPERVIRSSGPALHLRDEAVPIVERMVALYRDYAAGPRNPGVEIAIRNLTRGHDVFLTVREQLLCLITALEAAFGAFGRRREHPSLGRRIAEAYTIFRAETDGIENRVEKRIRAVRNAIAHGSDYRRELDYGGAAESLRDIMRVGLPPLLRLSTPAGADALGLAYEPGDDGLPTPRAAFQRLLTRSAKGEAKATEALTGLARVAN